MTVTTTNLATSADVPGVSYVDWAAIIAGAVGASAISFLLLTFGASMGLSMTSAWPNSGASVWATVLAVGWWAVLVQIGAFFAGGYVAGRMRARWGVARTDESRFRDGAHGFLVWSLGVMLGALVLAWTGSGVLKNATQAAATIGAGAASGNANALQTGPTDYAVDALLRPAPGNGNAVTTPAPEQLGAGATAAQPANAPAGNNGMLRGEVTRIYAATVKNGEFTARDRDYLTQVVMTRTGLPQQEAQQRVDQSVNDLKDAEIKARAAADKARRAALIAGFLTAASLLIGLGGAVFGAGLGGRHRDENTVAAVFGRRIW